MSSGSPELLQHWYIFLLISADFRQVLPWKWGTPGTLGNLKTIVLKQLTCLCDHTMRCYVTKREFMLTSRNWQMCVRLSSIFCFQLSHVLIEIFVILNHIFRDDDGSDEDSPPPGTASITSFFAPKKDSVVYQRHQFFRDRHLEPVNSF